MAIIPPTYENLRSVQATRPLTAWLIHAARSRRTMTYGQAKQRLEGECGFDVIFPVAMGRVAGAAMDRILRHVPDAPLLNVLLVRSDSGLPGSGAVGYLKRRYPNKLWLRKDGADKHAKWRGLVEQEAAHVYGYARWNDVYRLAYGGSLPASDINLAGKERDGTSRGGGEGENHEALRLKVTREPGLVRKGLRTEDTKTEFDLLSGDRVDVVSFAKDRTVAIEVKSRDSDWNDLRRGVYQCVKYRAVLAAQDIRQEPKVESWLVTETPLPGDLKSLARRLRVRTKVIRCE